jgi:hypothetical protein
MALSTYEMAQLGLAGAGAGLSAYAANQSTEQNKEQLAMQRRLEAMRNAQNLELQLLNRRDNQAVNFAEANPLGGEVDFARRQAIRSAILPGIARAASNPGGPTDPAIRSTFTSPTNPLAGIDLSRILATSSPTATAAALTDRRNATAGLDPEAAAYRTPLSALGVEGADDFDALANTRTTELLGQQDESEQALRESAKAQLNLTEEQAKELEKKGGSGFWKKLAKVGIIAGGAALMATGVGGPAGAMLIGAATGAGSGAIDGGWRGALIGAGTGALTGGMGGGAAGAGAARLAGATTGQLVRSAILNPQTLAQMAGAGIGGRTGAAIGLASNFLPGANYANLGVRNAGFEGANTTLGGVPGGVPIDRMAPTSPFLEGSRPSSIGFNPARPTVTPNSPQAPLQASRGPVGVRPPGGAPLTFGGGNAPVGQTTAPGAVPPPNVNQNPLFQRPGPFPGSQPGLPPPTNFGPTGPAAPQGPAPNLANNPLFRMASYGGTPQLPPRTNFNVGPGGAPTSPEPGPGVGLPSQFDLGLAGGGIPNTPPRVGPGPIPDPRFQFLQGQSVQGAPPGGLPGGAMGQRFLQTVGRQLGPYNLPGRTYGPAGLGNVSGGPGLPAGLPSGANPQIAQLIQSLPDGALRNFLLRGGR